MKIWRFIVLVTITAASACAIYKSKTERAFDAHESADPLIDSIYGYSGQVGLTHSEMRNIRFKNYQKYADELPHLENITKVYVGTTVDTGNLTITLIDVDGKEATIWVVGKKPGESPLPVRDITSY